MIERTINDADQRPRSVKTPAAENVYGRTLADSSAETDTGPSGPTIGAARDAYEVVQVIGEGGMGTISLARQVGLGRWVALKRLSAAFVDNARLLERFHAEARSIAALTHFHIVHVYTMAEDEEGPYIAMEYVPGPDFARAADWPAGLPNPPVDLEEYVKRQGVFDVSRTVQIGRTLCSAVGYAHKHGVIHRDIKPANIMVNEDDEPKLADFGLARQGGAERAGMTIAGAQLLTLGYGAPEQETDASRADERADIYALGGTLWFLLTGQNPRHFRESEVPEPLRDVLVRALQKDREKRFQTAGELEQALARLGPAVDGIPTPSDRTSLTPGRCPACGHQHVLQPKEVFSRKFCENCGKPMVEPCLKCGKENGVWAKFCGPCGADLVATLQATICRLQAEREQILALRKAFQFNDAIERLTRMDTSHPRLQEFSQWASETLGEVQREMSEAAHDHQAKFQSAQREMSAYNYEAAASLLEQVPLLLRNDPCKELLRTARARIEEMAKLRAEISEHVNSRQYKGLKAKVVRFLELQPGSKMQTLLQQIEQCEAQERKRCWQNAERQPSVAVYEQYLAAYPSGRYATLAHERIARCKAWEQEEFWKAVSRQATLDAYRQYLARYPHGSHFQEARAAVAPVLRERLLDFPFNVEIRQEYLKVRAGAAAKEDLTRAMRGSVGAAAVWGAIGGAA